MFLIGGIFPLNRRRNVCLYLVPVKQYTKKLTEELMYSGRVWRKVPKSDARSVL